MTHRPTSLKLLDESCPRALDHYEAGVPIDREIFQGGIAAHAILQAVGEETNRRGEILSYEDMQAVAAAVCSKLLTEGRSFDGVGEAPMSPYQAADGRGVALAWLAVNPLEPGAHYEIGLAVVEDGWDDLPYNGFDIEICPAEMDSDGATINPAVVDHVDPWLKTIIDYLREDEEDGERVLTVRDYKSNWNCDSSYLRHLQRKIQVLLGLAHFPDVDRVTVEVVNLRSRVTYREDHYLADESAEELLAEWRTDVETAIAAAEVKPREARPGVRCTGCWYLGACEDAQEWLATVSPQASKEDMATGYAVAVAEVVRLRDLLKKACGYAPVELEDSLVGYQRQPYRELKPDAYGALLEEWGGEAIDLETLAATTAAAISTGVQSVAEEVFGFKSDGTQSLALQGIEPIMIEAFKRCQMSESSIRGLLRALDLTKANAENALKVLYPERADIEHRKEFIAAHTEEKAKRRFLVSRK